MVAVINRRDQFHFWAVDSLKLDLLMAPGVLVLNWGVDNNRGRINTLMQKYSDTPASFADTCLVTMAGASRLPNVWTTDRHFEIYRLPGGKRIPVLAPS